VYEYPAKTFLSAVIAQGEEESIQTFVDLTVEQSESNREQEVIGQSEESELLKYPFELSQPYGSKYIST
jgi:hypothetical protein